VSRFSIKNGKDRKVVATTATV